MRRCVPFAFALLFAVAAFAEDPVGPAEYLKILADSKLTYSLDSKPAKQPVSEMTCERRDERTRVVAKDGKREVTRWVVAPEVLKLFAEGETFFQAEEYDKAAEKYRAGLAVDPDAVLGHYFLGDALLFGNKDAAGALAAYQKGLALDPTMPSGHLFSSTAYVRLGQPEKAREEIVKALTYYPGYEAVWKIANASPELWKARPVARHRFEPPAGFLGARNRNKVEIFPGSDAQWLGYAVCKAVWANEQRFADRHPKGSNWSIEEERACVLNQMFGTFNMTQSKLEKDGVAKDEKAVYAALPPLERHLYEVANANLLDGYILFEIFGQRCPLGMSMLDEKAIAMVDQYIRRYVIVPAE